MRLVTETWFGLVVLITVQSAVSFMLGLFETASFRGLAVRASIVWLLSAGTASWFMRRGFWLPTAATWVVVLGGTFGILYWIALPTGHASISRVLAFNDGLLVSSALAAMAGASVGHWRAARTRARVAT